MARLAGKTALITGAARGIGAAIARRFAQEGADLALCDLKLDSLDSVAADARSHGVATLTRAVDVTQRAQLQAFVDAAISQFSQLDILVNNAGIFFNAPFEQTSDEQYERIMDVNVRGVFLASQIVIRHWLPLEIKGVIVNLASIGAAIAFVDSSAYCLTKGAVASLTRCLALEYGPRGIRANSMAPGIIDTPMLPSQEDNQRWAKCRIPLRRLGQPGDVADLALFLASDESRYITGEMIFVDGGWMLE